MTARTRSTSTTRSAYRPILDGGPGNDHVRAGSGLSHLIGGPGRDHLFAGDSGNVLEGEGGDDDLNGGKGDDLLFGGEGDDKLSGGKGDDLLDGGLGIDDCNPGQGSRHRGELRAVGSPPASQSALLARRSGRSGWRLAVAACGRDARRCSRNAPRCGAG